MPPVAGVARGHVMPSGFLIEELEPHPSGAPRTRLSYIVQMEVNQTWRKITGARFSHAFLLRVCQLMTERFKQLASLLDTSTRPSTTKGSFLKALTRGRGLGSLRAPRITSKGGEDIKGVTLQHRQP